MDTGEEGCMAMTFQPGAGQAISWAADSRVQQALPMCVLGWDWARERETLVRHLEFSGKRAKLATWHEVFGVSLGTYCWLSIKHSLTTEKEGKAWRFEVLVGFVCGLFSFTIGKCYLYGGCLQNILGGISRSSFSCLSISLDHFQMNTTGLKGQTQPWLILCQCHLHKSPGGVHSFPPLRTWPILHETTLLIFLRFWGFFWWWSNCKAWFCPLKNAICISWEKAGDSVLHAAKQGLTLPLTHNRILVSLDSRGVASRVGCSLVCWWQNWAHATEIFVILWLSSWGSQT